ncbi:hypothetical protein EUGRSUZ_F02275 [Eucalyptus grandis]|uniref:Uncharacterized protein n=2 Tax=Eucalyptus grandis TaxID=71139 RepID=A0ACC3KHE6_EUCGR|nr:hypothetical protein EUGRSUZ_F02275 [Eucalyptus grandis]
MSGYWIPLPAEWLYSPLRGPTFRISSMPLPAVMRGVFYGLPSDVEVECEEFDCPSIPGLTYIRVRCLVMYDVGLAGGPVVQEFISVHVRRNGAMRGMLPPPPPDAPGWV